MMFTGPSQSKHADFIRVSKTSGFVVTRISNMKAILRNLYKYTVTDYGRREKLFHYFITFWNLKILLT